MKQLITALALLLSTTVVAQPDEDWWACQFVEDVGLDWVNGKWTPRNYALSSPFILFSDGNGSLTVESVAKAFKMGSPEHFTCIAHNLRNRISCASDFGVYLFFDPAGSRGGTSILTGAVDTSEPQRYSLSVSPFECTKS